MTNLEIEVRTIEFERNGEGVRIRFRGKDSEGQINMSGHVNVSMDQYTQNPSLDDLADVVRVKVIERLRGDEGDGDEENAE